MRNGLAGTPQKGANTLWQLCTHMHTHYRIANCLICTIIYNTFQSEVSLAALKMFRHFSQIRPQLIQINKSKENVSQLSHIMISGRDQSGLLSVLLNLFWYKSTLVLEGTGSSCSPETKAHIDIPQKQECTH